MSGGGTDSVGGGPGDAGSGGSHRGPRKSPPELVFLHVGLHKTGTTYLQNLMRANRDEIRLQDVEFTGGPGEPVQTFAVWDLQGRRPRGSDDKRVEGSWPALVETINTSGRRSALVSEERMSLCSVRQARRAVRAFPDSEVHVIVTVRDLARVIVSAWQEDLKNDKTWTWQEYADAARDPERVALSPARGFWLRQDVVKICEIWEAAVPASRLHVVTVPQPPAPPEELMRRFGSVVGIEPARFTEEPAWANETVGVAATEVIRRVNERLDGRLKQRQYDFAIKATLVPMLARRTDPVRFTLPESEFGWVSDRAGEMIAAIEERGYVVHGSLEDLRPVMREGRHPDDASDDELLETSLDALTALTERLGKAWWNRKSPDEPYGGKGSLTSRARSAAFRAQRRAAEVADSNPVAGRALTAVLRARDRVRTRLRLDDD